jgi:hypothetical protein
MVIGCRPSNNLSGHIHNKGSLSPEDPVIKLIGYILINEESDMVKSKHIFNWQMFLGVLLVLTGGLFLVDQLLGIQIMAYFWPLLVVLFGLTFFVSMLVAGRKGAGLAIPGAVITILGTLLFIQNAFSLWGTWTYAWALLTTAAGVGMLIMNGYLKREGLRRAAGVVIAIGLISFVVFGVLFEVILNISGSNIYSGAFLGVGLIMLGLFIVFSRPLFAHRKSVQAEETPVKDVLEVPYKDLPKEFPDVATQGEEQPKNYVEGAEFTRLTFKSVGEVFLSQGDTCDLRINGDPDLVKKVNTRVEDGVLTITYAVDVVDWTGLGWISAENRLRYTITVKELDQLTLGGAGVIRVEGLTGDKLKLHHSGLGLLNITGLNVSELGVILGGLGEVRLAGEVHTQVVALSGGGGYQAVDLRSQEADVTLTGAGTAKVWVEAELKASVSGAGSIVYRGEPQVDQSVSGLGGVKPL